MEWCSVPDLKKAGVQDPRTHGSTFPTLADEFYKQMPVMAYLRSWSEGNVFQFVFKVEDTADPPCHTDDTTSIAEQPAPLPPQLRIRATHANTRWPSETHLCVYDEVLIY